MNARDMYVDWSRTSFTTQDVELRWRKCGRTVQDFVFEGYGVDHVSQSDQEWTEEGSDDRNRRDVYRTGEGFQGVHVEGIVVVCVLWEEIGFADWECVAGRDDARRDNRQQCRRGTQNIFCSV